MLDSVWRASKEDFDVDAFLKKFSLKNKCSAIYHKGEKRHHSKIHGESGFNILISDNLDSTKNAAKIQKFIKQQSKAFKWLADNKITSEIDIGYFVNSSVDFYSM